MDKKVIPIVVGVVAVGGLAYWLLRRPKTLPLVDAKIGAIAGTQMTKYPGDPFTVTVSVKNTGAIAWTSGIIVEFGNTSGGVFTKDPLIPSYTTPQVQVEPGATQSYSVSSTVPSLLANVFDQSRDARVLVAPTGGGVTVWFEKIFSNQLFIKGVPMVADVMDFQISGER